VRSARDGKPIAEGALRNLAAARVGRHGAESNAPERKDSPARLSWQTGFQPVEVALGARDARLP